MPSTTWATASPSAGVNLEEAVQLITRAVAIEPGQRRLLRQPSAGPTTASGELEEAERYLARALEEMDDHETEEQAVILDHAGDIADALGKRDEAVLHWRRALDLTPGERGGPGEAGGPSGALTGRRAAGGGPPRGGRHPAPAAPPPTRAAPGLGRRRRGGCRPPCGRTSPPCRR